MVEDHGGLKGRDDSNINSDASSRLCDIPSFVEVDNGNTIDTGLTEGGDDAGSSKDSNVIIHANSVEGANDAARFTSVDPVEKDATQSFVEVRDDYYHHQHILESPKVPFKSSFSLQESMIDSSNIESLTLASDRRLTQNIDTPVNTSELPLGHSCFVNVGMHLNETASTNANARLESAHKILLNKDPESPDPSLLSNCAVNLFPSDVSTNVKSSSMPSLWSSFRLSCVGIVILLLLNDWSREDGFVIDASVEIEPTVLQPDIAAKFDYYVSQRGTEIHNLPHNINISCGCASQHRKEWLDLQTEGEPCFHLGGLARFLSLRIVIRYLSYHILLYCTCLILLHTYLHSRIKYLHGKIKRASSRSKQFSLLTTPCAVKRSTKELSTLEKVNGFGSTYSYEIVRNDGSKSKVRRSSRVILSSKRKMGEGIRLENCAVVSNLMNDLTIETVAN